MAAFGSASPWYLGFKAVVFALLACNTSFYLYAGTLSEALDATAWLVLLALFELEIGFDDCFRARGAATAVRGARLAAVAVVGAAAVGYVYQSEWLNAVNTGLWIAVVVLLELEVRHPRAVARPRDTLAERPVAGTGAKARCPQTAGFASNESARRRAWFAITAATLYAALGFLVLVWAWRGEWFDAYDALLWLTAFAMIEMDVLQIARREVAV